MNFKGMRVYHMLVCSRCFWLYLAMTWCFSCLDLLTIVVLGRSGINIARVLKVYLVCACN